MNYRHINFDVVQEACLAAESKEQLAQIFQASATGKLSVDVASVKADNLPEILKSLPEKLGISQDKSLVLIVSLHHLLLQYLGVCLPAQDEGPLVEAFPEDFDKSVKKFLFKQLREWAPLSKEHIQENLVGTSKLQDFDWRLDMKVASRQ